MRKWPRMTILESACTIHIFLIFIFMVRQIVKLVIQNFDTFMYVCVYIFFLKKEEIYCTNSPGLY